MDNEQIIKQLESIAENSKSFITKDSDPIWEKDIQAINAAIKIIENENTDISKNEEVYQKAIKTYGLTTQVDMVFEEMSELQKELCKYKRGEDNLDNISEEIADVEIMLDQMKLAFNLKEKVKKQKRFKIKRLEQRLLEKSQDKDKDIIGIGCRWSKYIIYNDKFICIKTKNECKFACPNEQRCYFLYGKGPLKNEKLKEIEERLKRGI